MKKIFELFKIMKKIFTNFANCFRHFSEIEIFEFIFNGLKQKK